MMLVNINKIVCAAVMLAVSSLSMSADNGISQRDVIVRQLIKHQRKVNSVSPQPIPVRPVQTIILRNSYRLSSVAPSVGNRISAAHHTDSQLIEDVNKLKQKREHIARLKSVRNQHQGKLDKLAEQINYLDEDYRCGAVGISEYRHEMNIIFDDIYFVKNEIQRIDRRIRDLESGKTFDTNNKQAFNYGR